MEYFSQRDMTRDAKLAGEAHALRAKLTRMLDLMDQEPMAAKPPAAALQVADTRPALAQVRAIMKARRTRDRLFAAGLFADPAWDLLLELYAAELCGYRVSVTGLCNAASVPTTTALRWIGRLEEKGLARRSPDPQDARRVFILLSDEGLEAMGEMMRQVPPLISLM